MKLLMAFDSFKGTLTSTEAGSIAAKAAIALGCEAKIAAVSDGGEGMTEAFISANQAKMLSVRAVDPLYNEIDVKFAMSGTTALIECAFAAGLGLVPPSKRNPRKTTTYGLGMMIKKALDNGAKKVIIGLGGSATNDGGTGMAAALGAIFKNSHGESFIPTGETLGEISSIDIAHMHNRIAEAEFVACCDVTNPLCGNNGASHIYAPQKGASESDVELLEANMLHYASMLGNGIADFPGSGAAGGLGAAVKYYLSGTLAPGFEVISSLIGLEDKIMNADVILTGEGCTDSQTENGKLPAGVAKIARKYSKPCYIISGAVKGKPHIYGALKIIPTTEMPGMPTKEIAAERLYNTIYNLLEETII